MRLSAQFAILFDRIRDTEPIEKTYDVVWWGPYFIPKPRQWHRSRFLLYGGRLHGSIEVGWTTYSSTWDISSGEIEFENGSGYSIWNSQEVWTSALPQLTRRLKYANENPDAFNRRVRRLIPYESRTGRLIRKWTWPKRTSSPLSRNELVRLELACVKGANERSWVSLTSGKYLQVVGCAYDAAFPELRHLAAREKYSLKADSRHCGLLDLPDQDDRAFRGWYNSKAWVGSHPWEIVFAHPHGVLLSPFTEQDGNWRFHLSVDTAGLFLHAVKMAIALGDISTPFLLHDKNKIVSMLRGQDLVEIGPYYNQIP
ncbi:MAG: hypothetical protein HY896_08490, partial [Deltaproteobacteria bacterium]|nr:hypothetical protein [Deltaproteobacteria bacterium]